MPRKKVTVDAGIMALWIYAGLLLIAEVLTTYNLKTGMIVRDDECQCCTDLSESIKDPCGEGTAEPCIPEAATIAMVGVDILGIIGIGLRRREL